VYHFGKRTFDRVIHAHQGSRTLTVARCPCGRCLCTRF
jgi:hypothetical protein